MAFRYYSKEELAKLLGVSVEDFHRYAKRCVKSDFKSELQAIEVDNPDIWLNKDYEMRLVDPGDSSNYHDTSLDFRLYI